MRLSRCFTGIFIIAAGLSACARNAEPEGLLETLAAAEMIDVAAQFINTDGSDIGAAVAVQAPEGVLIRVDLKGLSPGWHAIHLHKVADCSDGAAGFKASGGHFNPDGRAHGLLNPDGPEKADLPNIYAGPDGRATVEMFRHAVALEASEESAAIGGAHPLLDEDGFAIIVHAGAYDHLTQPIGGAGGRVACAAFKSK